MALVFCARPLNLSVQAPIKIKKIEIFPIKLNLYPYLFLNACIRFGRALGSVVVKALHY